jgi:hypothetical protein
MVDIRYFTSSNRYVYLPTKNNPKVILSIDNNQISDNSFRLYNPFSTKARYLKLVYIKLIPIIRLFSKQQEKSKFIKFVEKRLNLKLTSSIYIATDRDKVVIQIQDSNKIVGYIKYPLNNIGIEHINSEKKAIDILSKNSIIDSYILNDTFEDKPFIILKELDGVIDNIEQNRIDNILDRFKREKRYKLSNHPRIKSLYSSEFKEKIDLIINSSKDNYLLVYEHGDFTPWNIIKSKDEYTPFDFEYFVEDGIEYFDLIKYHYQVGKLLNRLDGSNLINYILDRLDTKENRELLGLFLIKEIDLNSKNSSFERDILKILGDFNG